MVKEKIKNIIYFFLNIFFLKAEYAELSILTYHSVDNNPIFFTVTPKDFFKQMQYLKVNNYKVISLFTLLDCLKNKSSLSEKAVILTFDDGYRDNYLQAWSILKKFNFPMTIFLSTANIDQTINNSKNTPLQALNHNEIKEMSASGIVEFGSHTHTHPKLKKIDDNQFRQEIRESKKIIENLTGKPCFSFAYPKGYYRDSFANILQEEGYTCAFTIQEGLCRAGGNLFFLPRNFINSQGGWQQFKGKLGKPVAIYNYLYNLYKNKNKINGN